MRREKREHNRSRGSVRPAGQASRANHRRDSELIPVNPEHERLINWMQTVKFRKTMIGGINEVQLWKKLEELNQIYDAALRAERVRYDTLLDSQKRASGTLLRKYKQQLAEVSSGRSGSGAVREERSRGDAY